MRFGRGSRQYPVETAKLKLGFGLRDIESGGNPRITVIGNQGVDVRAAPPRPARRDAVPSNGGPKAPLTLVASR